MQTPESTTISLQRKSQSNAERAVVVTCIHDGWSNHAGAVPIGGVFNPRDTFAQASR